MIKTCVSAAGLYCGLGMSIPIGPNLAGICAVILVRLILWSRNQSIVWNIAVCGLAILATFASLEGSQISTFYAFWMGTGYGAIGVGIIEIGKNATLTATLGRLKLALQVLTGTQIKDDTENEEEK